PVKVAGRIMLNRGSFIVLQDSSERLQVYVNRKTLPEETLAEIKTWTWATSSAPKACWPARARATCTST
ncbi:lysine-tRNA ligase, partial [Pseudomonas aeruginosa]